jgi:hypothetical protein
MLRYVIPALLCTTAALVAQLPVPFAQTPAHETDKTGVTTGGAFADINQDGWPDLVVANGNDIKRQRVAVYLNSKGQFPVRPSWSSADVDYHGHLDVGDVNGDGWPDVAVSVYLGAAGFGEKGRVKLYLNDGQGQLSSQPSWVSQDRFYSFSCALGDYDADGDLDLAVATGEAYKNPKDYDRIYRNDGGQLTALPVWLSSVATHSMDVAWCDVDDDGDLDIAFAGAKGGNTIHRNSAGVIPTAPTWTSTDGGSKHSGNSLCFGDIDGDGRPDLIVSDNKQLGGTGTFRAYRNLGSSFGTSAFWASNYFGNGYTSAVRLLDYDRDGDLDLVAGGWWTTTAIFRNDAGVLSKSPNWQSSGTSVVEALFCADIDRNGLRQQLSEVLPVRPGRTLYQLRHAEVQQLQSVRVDNFALQPGQYSFHRESGVLSLAQAPARNLHVDYLWSEATDLGVTNWDQDKGNFIYPRRAPVEFSLTPPAKTSFGPGEAIAWRDRFEVTTESAQLFVYIQRLESVAGPGQLDILILPIALPGGLVIPQVPWALYVPKPLDPALLGDYRYRGLLLDLRNTVFSDDAFVFRLVP